MKSLVSAILILGVTLGCSPKPAAAQDNRERFKSTFQSLQEKYKTHSSTKPAGVFKYQVPNGNAAISSDKFDLDVPSPVPGHPPCQMGVKIWAQLAGSDGSPSGPYVNLVKHKWQREERFFLWFESAVPLTLGLFQSYPDNIRPNKQVAPNDHYPSTFATIMPGRPWMFPMRLVMDDNLNDEIMNITLVRSDYDQLPVYSPGMRPSDNPPELVQGDPTTSGEGGSMKFATATKNTLKSLYETAEKTGKVGGVSVKFDIDGPPTDFPPQSNSPDDVTFYLFGAGKVGLVTLTLHKD